MKNPTAKEISDWRLQVSLEIDTDREELKPLVNAFRVLSKIVVGLAEQVEEIKNPKGV